MHTKLLIFCFSLLAPWLLAQQTKDYQPLAGIKAQVLGSIIYPGLQLGYERPYQVTKGMSGNATKYYKERYIAGHLGFYHHARFHTNLMLQGEWIARNQKTKGFFYEFNTGLGISRTFLAGPAYEVNEQGEVSKIPLAGNWFAMLSVGGAAGYNLRLNQKQDFTIFSRLRGLFFFPYNNVLYGRPSLELGLTYHLYAPKWNGRLKEKTKNRQKTAKS